MGGLRFLNKLAWYETEGETKRIIDHYLDEKIKSGGVLA